MPGLCPRLLLPLVLLVAVVLPSVIEGQGISTTVGTAHTGNLSQITTGKEKVSAARLKELVDEWRLTPEEAEAIGEPHGAGK
jgi:hypothetical protein